MTSKYVFWNNKGGVGKTLLTFLCATEYAVKHPEKNVLVIDICPQADITQFLFNSFRDEGNSYLEILEKKETIGGYFKKRINERPYQKLGIESDYFLLCNKFNNKLPSNLYLVAGDNSLENIASNLSALSVQNHTDNNGKTYYKEIYSYVRDLQETFTTKYGDNSVCFIDTNPAFSIYTKMALYAAERLVVPCLPDLGSYLAFSNVMKLVYGIDKESNNQFILDSEKYGFKLPIIFKIVLGRSTIYDKSSAKAFKNIEQKIVKTINNLKSKYNGKIFINETVEYRLRDMNSITPALYDTGKLLTDLNISEPLTNDTTIQLNKLEQYKEGEGSIVNLINSL